MTRVPCEPARRDRHCGMRNGDRRSRRALGPNVSVGSPKRQDSRAGRPSSANWDEMSLCGARNDEIRQLAGAFMPDEKAISSVSAPWGAKASRRALDPLRAGLAAHRQQYAAQHGDPSRPGNRRGSPAPERRAGWPENSADWPGVRYLMVLVSALRSAWRWSSV